MSSLPPAVIQALQEAELIQKHDRLCDLAAIDAIPIELLDLLTLNNQIFDLSQLHFKNNTDPFNNPEFLRELSRSTKGMLRCKVAHNPATPVDVLVLLADDPYDDITDGRNDSKIVRSAVAGNPSTPVDILRKLSRDPSCIGSIARNFNTPLDILEELAETDSRYARVMTKNLLLPSHILSKIANIHPNHIDILEDICRHPNTSASTLTILANHDSNSYSYRIRVAVAENPNTPTEVLTDLSSDPYKEIEVVGKHYAHFLVQEGLAGNPNTPIPVLELLFQYKNFYVCLELAKNTALPNHILRELMVKNDYVLHEYPNYFGFPICRSSFNIELITNSPLKESYLTSIQLCIAKNNSTPIDLLDTLSKHREYYVRLAVSQNKNAPIDILEKLSHSKARGVREAAQSQLRSIYRELAANPNTSTEKLWEILYHRDIEIRLAVLLHPQGLNLLLDRALQLENSLNRFIAGLHPQLSAVQRDKLFYSANWLDRLAIACNPSTSSEYLQILIQDSHDLIRYIVSHKIM